jgi:fatty acid desaturase
MREHITTALELAGLLMLTAAAMAFVLQWSLPGALAVGGVLLLGASALIVARTPKPTHEETTA